MGLEEELVRVQEMSIHSFQHNMKTEYKTIKDGILENEGLVK